MAGALPWTGSVTRAESPPHQGEQRGNGGADSRACPEPGLSPSACRGKYTTGGAVVLSTQHPAPSTQHLDSIP